jgi:hypothetical protein
MEEPEDFVPFSPDVPSISVNLLKGHHRLLLDSSKLSCLSDLVGKEALETSLYRAQSVIWLAFLL